MKCFLCEKEIAVGEDAYYLVPIESPYGNIFFHLETCYRQIKGHEKEYFQNNAERLYEYLNTKKK